MRGAAATSAIFGRALIADDAEFARRLVASFGILPGDLGDSLVLAGGAALATLLQPEARKYCDDVDLYFVGCGDDEARALLDRLGGRLAERFGPQGGLGSKLTVHRTPRTVTFAFFMGHYVRVQVVLRANPSIEELLRNVDIGACAIAWDGRRVALTPRSRLAVGHGVFAFDPQRLEYEYAVRCHKYLMRGFSMLIPGCRAPPPTCDISLGGLDLRFRLGECVQVAPTPESKGPVSAARYETICESEALYDDAHSDLVNNLASALGLRPPGARVASGAWPAHGGAAALQPAAGPDEYALICAELESAYIGPFGEIAEVFFAPFAEWLERDAEWLEEDDENSDFNFMTRRRAAIAVRLVALQPAMAFPLTIRPFTPFCAARSITAREAYGSLAI